MEHLHLLEKLCWGERRGSYNYLPSAYFLVGWNIEWNKSIPFIVLITQYSEISICTQAISIKKNNPH